MSISVVRYIELLSIEQVNEVHFLHIHVQLQETTELFMEIDAFTAENLLRQCAFEPDYKYRLSLRAFAEIYSNRILSTITKTQLTKSERLDFEVSPIYKQKITQIKNCTSTEELKNLPFVYVYGENDEIISDSTKNGQILQYVQDELLAQQTIEQPSPEITVDESSHEEAMVQEEVARESLNFEPEAVLPHLTFEETAFLHNAEPFVIEQSQGELPLGRKLTSEEIIDDKLGTITDNTNVQLVHPEAPSVTKDELDEVTQQAAVVSEVQKKEQQSAIEIDVQVDRVPKFEKGTNPPKTLDVTPLSVEITPISDELEGPQKRLKPSGLFPKWAVYSGIAVVLLLIVGCTAFITVKSKTPPTQLAYSFETDLPIEPNTSQVMYDLTDTYSFSLSTNYVALTFSKGPSVYSDDIVAILNEQRIGATFFFIGKNVDKYPDIVRSIAESGYSIGHATENYSLLTNLSAKQQQRAWQTTAKKIETLTNKPVTMFRPPYGVFNNETISVVEQNHLNIVAWNIDPYTIQAQNADGIIKYINEQPLNGAIINLQESSATVEALPAIIELLKNNDLKIVTLQ